MFRLTPPLVLLFCVLLFILGANRFAPAPLDLLFSRSRVEIAIVRAPPKAQFYALEENATLSDEINATDAESVGEANLSQEPSVVYEPLIEEPPTPKKMDGLQRLLTNFGYPFASGDLQKRACASGQTCAANGVLRGLNFSELYCKAAAFSKGREMPKYAPSPSQSFEAMQFWLSKRPAGMDAIYLASDPFVLSGSLYEERGALKGSLSLSYNARWRFPCEISEGWQNVALPLRCAVRRRQNALDCSLDLRALIESLSGVAAKTSEPARQRQVKELQENLQEQFKHRVRERPNIEEIDLRYLF
ncbi:MAG: hypothetical protein LBF86_03380 [Helicobacteraceae bacterium]|jgi:hypothetical protein|nr:hypothetical protein [Helicobacteraceae bacterium]